MIYGESSVHQEGASFHEDKGMPDLRACGAGRQALQEKYRSVSGCSFGSGLSEDTGQAKKKDAQICSVGWRAIVNNENMRRLLEFWTEAAEYCWDFGTPVLDASEWGIGLLIETVASGAENDFDRRIGVVLDSRESAGLAAFTVAALAPMDIVARIVRAYRFDLDWQAELLRVATEMLGLSPELADEVLSPVSVSMPVMMLIAERELLLSDVRGLLLRLQVDGHWQGWDSLAKVQVAQARFETDYALAFGS